MVCRLILRHIYYLYSSLYNKEYLLHYTLQKLSLKNAIIVRPLFTPLTLTDNLVVY